MGCVQARKGNYIKILVVKGDHLSNVIFKNFIYINYIYIFYIFLTLFYYFAPQMFSSHKLMLQFVKIHCRTLYTRAMAI